MPDIAKHDESKGVTPNKPEESPPNLTDGGQSELDSTAQLSPSSNHHHHRKSFHSMTPYEFGSLLFSGFTFVAVVITAFVYFYQLREMQKATQATQIAAKAAENAAKVAEGQLDQMKSGAEQTEKIIAEANRISVSLHEVDPESWTAGDGLHKPNRNCPTCPKNDASIVRL